MVGGGIRHGRNALIQDLQAAADLGVADATSNAIAIRGERLALTRVRYSRRDEEPHPFHAEFLQIIEIDADARLAVLAALDLDDFDAAIAELDARYLAGEASAHADTWSVIAEAHAGFNRQELPATTPDPVYIDHRPLVSIEGVDLGATLRPVWDITPASSVYIEAVHRLDELGAVATQVLKGTSKQGLDAEWRMIDVFTVEGDLYNRVEVFDEADLDAALARFDELHSQTRRLENAASRASRRYLERFVARDWDTMAEMLAEDYYTDDRRRVVGGGIHGRDVEIANAQVQANVGVTHAVPTAIAVRGERLALSRVRYSGRDQDLEAFLVEVLIVFEVNADNRFAAVIAFDLDDIDAAFNELDARYVAGEAAVHAHTWSVVSGAYAAMNRHELFATTPGWANVDHRRPGILEEGGLNASLRSLWKLVPDISFRVVAVHRLSNLGAVCSHAAHGVSEEGFDAEWRGIEVMTVDRHLINRCEIFDEADLDAALACFDELHAQARQLENAATRVYQRLESYFVARDWNAMAETLADDISTDDRRRVVGAGRQQGRDAVIAEISAVAEIGVKSMTPEIIAIRGGGLVLSRVRSSGRDQRPDAFRTDVLDILEIDADERVVARVVFDPDDFDAAIAELDARYLAGEGAAHAHTWSLMAGAFAAVNRHELPGLTPDWVNIDHRRGAAFATGDMTAYIRDLWDDAPDINVYVEVVHCVSNLGAVITQAAHGTSQHGFEAEWRENAIFTFDGDLISRCELFDEADLDAALARFEELQPQPPRLENAATQVDQRFWTHFAGPRLGRHGGAARQRHFHRRSSSGRECRRPARSRQPHRGDASRRRSGDREHCGDRHGDPRGAPRPHSYLRLQPRNWGRRFQRRGAQHCCGWSGSKVLCVSEINAENQIVARVAFDSDDLDAAFAELDARYLAGEAAPYANTWSAIAGAYVAFNRHEIPATPDWANVDHRRATTVAPGDMAANIRATWDVAPNISRSIEAVHRLDNLGAVVTHTAYGTSREGFDAEWRLVALLTFTGDLISRAELFDEADLGAALARFDELDRNAEKAR